MKRKKSLHNVILYIYFIEAARSTTVQDVVFELHTVSEVAFLRLLCFFLVPIRSISKDLGYVHRLNIELDLQSLFGLLCTTILIG